ncbi:MAG: DUF5652 family protein [Bacteroidales bacterium]|jgi:hypothetical protein|nr:hypothetical protein [Bacteroidales bacterium]
MYLFSANKIHLILIILIVWDMVWRSIALWKSARNKHLAWFICLIIFNTIGVLPIIYILIDRYKKKEEEIA